MSKSFISILGTNNYLECRHSFNGLTSKQPVKYAQEDLIKFFCKDFDEQSEIRIFLTKDAKEKNWLNDGHKDKDNKPLPNKGLEERLSELSIKAKIKTIDIHEGFNENEIWDNFQKIYDTISENEEVIVDITHSFRSLPMLLITLLNYAKQLKKIKVLGIYYAAFESLGTIQEVNKINPEERIVPILDLTSFSELQDWTNATFDFVNNANVKQIQKLINKSDKESTINDPKTRFFPSAVVKKLDNLISDIALCRGKDLSQFNFIGLKDKLKELKNNQDIPAAFIYLVDVIEEKISKFENDSGKLLITITDWCIKHNLFQQAITLLQEFTITFVLNELKLDISNKTNRELVAQAFKIKSKDISINDWSYPANENQDTIKNIFNLYLFKNEDLFKTFEKLSDIRNDVNHAGFLKDARSVKRIKNRLSKIQNFYVNIFSNLC